MALFIDGPPSSIEDLTDQDSGLLDVCQTERINTTTKLALGRDEVAVDLAILFERQRYRCASLFAAKGLDVDHLAVTPPLKMWHTWLTLALIYRDAYFGQLNDRYKAKWDEYQSLATSARLKLQETGVGIVLDPLRRPGGPLLSPIPATEGGGTFYAAVSFLNANGEESAASPAESITIPDGNAVDIQLISPLINALGWNVYAGISPETMYLQNESPLSIGGDFVYYASTAATSGDTPGPGQTPNLIRPLPRLIQRG